MRIFTQEIIVEAQDIDIQKRVSNLCYVQWMQDLAIQHSTSVGWSMERYEAVGQSWVVRQHTWVSAFAPRQSLRRYLFWRGADKTLLAEAETNWVYIDLKSGRPIRLPDELRAAFETVEDNSEVLRLLRK